MKLEIERLKDNLAESQKSINNLIQENNKFKLLQIENSKNYLSKKILLILIKLRLIDYKQKIAL